MSNNRGNPQPNNACVALQSIKGQLPAYPLSDQFELTPNEEQEAVRDAALLWAVKGFPIIPLHYPIFADNSVQCSCEKGKDCRSIGKHPYSRLARRGVNSATTNASRIEEWFKQEPNLNYGISCEGLVVLDIDPRHGGNETFKKLENDHGILPTTLRITTGSKGLHILFDAKNETYRNGILGPGIDIKSKGGYIVGACSLHASGRRYVPDQRYVGSGLAPLPEWLAGLLKKSTSIPGQSKTPQEWLDIVNAGLLEGARNTTITRVAGLLLRRYVPIDITLSLLLAWNQQKGQPPLDDDEVLKIINSIAGREAERRQKKDTRYGK